MEMLIVVDLRSQPLAVADGGGVVDGDVESKLHFLFVLLIPRAFPFKNANLDDRHLGFRDWREPDVGRFAGRVEKLIALIDLAEKLMKRTVAQLMTSEATDCVEHDFGHAFADPEGSDASRPKPRATPHTERDPELAQIRQLELELEELVDDEEAAWAAGHASSDAPPSADARAAAASADVAGAKQLAEWRQLFQY